MPDIDDLFTSFAGTAAPSLDGAPAARARGEQRSRRRRAASAVGATLSVLALVAVGAAIGTTARPESLGPAGPAPTPPAVAPVEPGELLDPDDLAGAFGGTWEQVTRSDEVGRAFPVGCGDADPAADARELRRTDAPVVVHSDVRSYPDAAAALDALGRLVDEVEQCPATTRGSAAVEQQLLGGPSRTGPGVVYGVQTEGGQDAHFVVAAVGELLVAASVQQPVTGDAQLVALLDVLTDLVLAEAGGGAPAATPTAETPSADWRVQDALLTAQEAAAAEGPGWAVDEDAEPPAEPVLDPCQDGAQPDGVVDLAEQRTRSEREAGGSTLVQEVARFRTAAAAGAALDAALGRVASCPEQRQGDGVSTTRLLVVSTSEEGGLRKALVRAESCFEGQCPVQFRSYYLLAQTGNGLTTASYVIDEDGDPQDQAERLLTSLAQRLARTVGVPTVPEVDAAVSFVSPTGRISCSLTPTQASCDTSDVAYEPPPRPADCDLDWGGMLVLDAGGARFVCHGDTNRTEDARVLAYGEQVGNGSWTCTSRETGMECREDGGTRGFVLSRSRYALS